MWRSFCERRWQTEPTLSPSLRQVRERQDCSRRERISHTRAFRRAKKSLRIRSLRLGFGSRSHWLWELPRENERSARAERKPAPLRRIPSDWIEGIACLNPDRPPSDVPRHRWRPFVDDCTNFLSPSERYSAFAITFCWAVAAGTGRASEVHGRTASAAFDANEPTETL